MTSDFRAKSDLSGGALRSAARISLFTLFLASMTLLVTVPTVLILSWLASRVTTFLDIMLVAIAAAALLIALIPVVMLFLMSWQFRAFRRSSKLIAALGPLHSIRLATAWIAALAVVGEILLIGWLFSDLASPRRIAKLGEDPEEVTVARMREVSAALDDYARRHHRYPKVESYSALRTVIGSYEGQDVLAATDGWDHALVYSVTDHNVLGSEYTLLSLGEDGMRQDSSETSFRRGGKKTPEELAGRDIKIESGVFVSGPEDALGLASRMRTE
jgi:hypothetical protein